MSALSILEMLQIGSSPTATGTAGQAGGEEDEVNEDQV